MVNDTVDKLRRLQAEAKGALDETGMVRKDEHQISRFQSFLHFWVLVCKSFVRNRCPVRSSALAYASLLAMVPMLAVVISVSSSLLKSQGTEPIEKVITAIVSSVMPEPDYDEEDDFVPTESTQATTATPNSNQNPSKDNLKLAETRKEAATRIKEFIGNIQSGTLGVTGVLGLLFVAITMLARIEDTFNDIWGVSRGRSWYSRVVQYWAAITLGPLLLAVVIGMTTSTQLKAVTGMMSGLPLGVGSLISFLLRFLPFVILSLAFALFYQLMPNTKVHWRAALVGGIVGGTLWQVNHMINVVYVARMLKNSKIYGGLAMVPVFMVGLYFSWIILLFGSQVAYAFQNRRTYLAAKQAEGVHQRSREFIALRLMAQIGARFLRGEKPPTLTELAEHADVPSRLAGQILHTLVATKLLAEVTDGEAAFVPGRPMDRITAQDVLFALRAGQGLDLTTRDDATRALVRRYFDTITAAEKKCASDFTLQSMVEQMQTAGTPV